MARALAPGKQWRRPTLRRRLDLTPGSAAKCRPPPAKLVLPIVSTVFGALLIRWQLHRPIVPAWVGKKRNRTHGNSSLSETSTLIRLRVDRRQASPTVLGDQLDKIG